MARLYGTLFTSSLLLMLLGMMTSVKSKIVVNRCEGSSTAGSCTQECDEDCKMSCARATPPLKSCDHVCWDSQCDMKCVAKETCHPTCDTLLNCGLVRCTTANCPQLCDVGACNLSCRARSRCKQSCNQCSCYLKCPTGDHCKQVTKSGIRPATFTVAKCSSMCKRPKFWSPARQFPAQNFKGKLLQQSGVTKNLREKVICKRKQK